MLAAQKSNLFFGKRLYWFFFFVMYPCSWTVRSNPVHYECWSFFLPFIKKQHVNKKRRISISRLVSERWSKHPQSLTVLQLVLGRHLVSFGNFRCWFVCHLMFHESVIKAMPLSLVSASPAFWSGDSALFQKMGNITPPPYNSENIDWRKLPSMMGKELKAHLAIGDLLP